MNKEIIIHCSATRPEWMESEQPQAKVDEIRRWHKENGWSDIGYHWIIDRNGIVIQGRDELVSGAHTKGHNSGTIGICLIGGFGASANDKFTDHFTDEQDLALRALIRNIIDRHPSIKKVSGHNDYDAGKACPGFRVSRWVEGKGERKVVESRSMIGQAAAATGTVGVATIESIAPVLTEAAQQVQPLIQFSGTLKAAFIFLTLAGIALTIYARLDDWKRGKR